MAGINNPIYDEAYKPSGVLLDSNLRFLNGLSVGVGLCALSIIPNIKSRSAELRIICALIFFGAVGRMLSVASHGLPPSPFDIVTFFELAIPPLLAYWQSRISG
ncbi:DUF4345 domain-containing protein [Dyadobacter fermentans]|uniref:DUF4345 domain-containing protein n=1 Tax=Dyadobacter fermentans TaxID=94254 RepID=UPI0035B6218B